MATVRFSKELRDTILKKADDLFAKRIQAVKENIPADWAMRMYDGMFGGDTINKMNALPDGYIETTVSIDLQGVSASDDSDGNPDNHNISLNLPAEMPWPYDIHDFTEHGVLDANWGLKLLADDERWATLIPEYLEYCRAIDVVEAEKRKFKQGVTQIIEAYVTLGPALKAWPALWDLLPKHAQNKHKEVVTRVKKEISEIAEGVDLNQLTSTVVLDKLVK